MSGQLGFFIHLSLILLVAFILLKPLFRGRKHLPEVYLQQMNWVHKAQIDNQTESADARFYIAMATPMTRREFNTFLNTYVMYFEEAPNAN